MKEAVNKKIFIKREYPKSEFFKSMKVEGAMFSATKAELVAPIDGRTGKVRTGLEDGWTKEEITNFEYELQLPEGSLRSADFWADYKIMIPPTGKWIDLNTAKGRLEYMVLSQIKTVAKSLDELAAISTAANMNYGAVFVMRNYEDEAKSKVSKVDVKKKAYKKADAMGPEDMANYLVYLGETPQSMSRDVIESKLYEDLELNPARFLATIEQEAFEKVVFIKKCIFHNILTQRGQVIYHGGQVMASNMEAAIEHIYEPGNQALKLALLADLEAIEKKSSEEPTKGKKSK
jgi:hypothetical protein